MEFLLVFPSHAARVWLVMQHRPHASVSVSVGKIACKCQQYDREHLHLTEKEKAIIRPDKSLNVHKSVFYLILIFFLEGIGLLQISERKYLYSTRVWVTQANALLA